jgi:hypothetical protein
MSSTDSSDFWKVEVWRAEKWCRVTGGPFALVIGDGKARLSWTTGSPIRPPWRVWNAGVLIAMDREGLPSDS